jgi:hypothetical protein
MKQVCIIILFLSVLVSNSILSQTGKANTEADLIGMFSRLRENLSTAEKLIINDSVKLIIDSYAASDSVFKHRFSNLRFLGQVTSPDNIIKILTWNLILEDGGNRYFCYIIKRNQSGSRNHVYRLAGLYNEAPIRTDTIYSESSWYGALYYDIRPFKSVNSTRYILLGIDYGNSFITRKIIDVLSFDPEDRLVFGYKCFTDGKQILPRVVFEFAATAVMSLKFDSEKLIVFDHLSPFSPELKDNRQFYGPDFSFDSYSLENGLWKLKSNIDIRNK